MQFKNHTTVQGTNLILEHSIEQHKKNLEVLTQLEHLPANWNGYGAPEISLSVVEHVRQILQDAQIQPQMIVPTGRGTIQLEYEEPNGKYLEFDVGQYAVDILYLPIDGDEIEEEQASDIRVFELIQRYHAE